MTPKETRLNYKAKKNAYEGDPQNEKAKAEYLSAKKAYEELDRLIADTETGKGQKAAAKAPSKPKEAAPKAATKQDPPAAETAAGAEQGAAPQEDDDSKKNPDQE